MTTWKSGILELDEWIQFQEKVNPNFTISNIRIRITEMIFGLTLEELKESSDPADIELFNERIVAGEIVMPDKVGRYRVNRVKENE